jgi:hypothetical protein
MRLFPAGRLRHIIVSTLLVAMSIAMGMALFRIWQIKQDVDAIGLKLTLEQGPQTTLIYDSKDRVIASSHAGEPRAGVRSTGEGHPRR